jgi:hypothetical protein
MSYRPVLGTMTLFFLLYCALLGVGTWLLIDRANPEREVRFRAVRSMALNHVVQQSDLAAVDEGQGKATGDVALAKLVGRYAQLAVRAGQSLGADDFTAAPLLAPTPNRIAVGMPAKDGLAGNAGMVYRVCKPNGDGKGETLVAEFEAGALLCNKGSTSCTVIAYLKTADARALLAALPEVGMIEARPTACQSPRPTRPERKAQDAERED